MPNLADWPPWFSSARLITVTYECRDHRVYSSARDNKRVNVRHSDDSQSTLDIVTKASMTSPIEKIMVQCPKCGNDYEDWYRASINLMLDDFDEDYLRQASTATCPVWKHTVDLGVLTVRKDGVWEIPEEE